MTYKIYKLTNDEGQNYIGSTNLDLTKRFRCHKNAFKRYINNKMDLYCSAYEVFKGSNAKIECIEDLGEISKQEARHKENKYITDLDCVNKYKAIITEEERQEYINKNREKNIEYAKTYYTNNKAYWKTEEFKQKQKEYYKQHKARIIARVKDNYKTKKTNLLNNELI